MDKFLCDGRVSPVYWLNPVPAFCECCGSVLTGVFVDCKTFLGPWASLCVECAGDLAVASEPPLCRVYQFCSEGWVSVF